MPRIIVGVDAGASAVRAVAADGSHIIGQGTAGGANPNVVGLVAAVESISHAVESALAGERTDLLCVGVAGAGREQVARRLEALLATRFSQARIVVTDDAQIALLAGAPEGIGAVLVAGTGAVAYAQNRERKAHAGGYGALLGDRGSGFALGAAALEMLLRVYDGRGVSDALTQALATLLSAESRAEVLAAIYEDAQPVKRIASLAQTVLALADAGDRAATKIVQAAALELFELAKCVLRMTELSDRDGVLVFSGGLLSKNSLLTYLIETRVANEMPAVRIVKDAPAPQFGALNLARMLPAGGRHE
ncbi:MAG: N-acetylglucosamine kinase [Vulcanimicrobiaceae bacterium]